MTNQEASDEAIRRWGERGACRWEAYRLKHATVGVWFGDKQMQLYGEGVTYEEAFQDATNRGY